MFPQGLKKHLFWVFLIVVSSYCLVFFTPFFLDKHQDLPLPQSKNVDMEPYRGSQVDTVQGNPSTEYNLGLKYFKGEEVPQDYKKAAMWFQKAAEAGIIQAQLNLGFCYSKGKGVPQDNEKAVMWFRKSAEGGMAEAQFNLGLMYFIGIGVPQDCILALMWYSLAAQNGDKNAPKVLSSVKGKMTRDQVEKAQELVRNWKPE